MQQASLSSTWAYAVQADGGFPQTHSVLLYGLAHSPMILDAVEENRERIKIKGKQNLKFKESGKKSTTDSLKMFLEQPISILE